MLSTLTLALALAWSRSRVLFSVMFVMARLTRRSPTIPAAPTQTTRRTPRRPNARRRAAMEKLRAKFIWILTPGKKRRKEIEDAGYTERRDEKAPARIGSERGL